MKAERQPATEAAMERATEWYWRLRETDVEPETVLGWQSWLSASPDHLQAFAQVEATLRQMDLIQDVPWPSETELLHDDYDGSTSVEDWRARPSRPRAAGVLRSWGIAAAVLLFLATGSMLLGPFDLDTPAAPDFALYSTHPAEHREIVLPDGSVVALGGKSTVSVAYSPETRLILLEQGAAYFEVAKNAARPFIVRAGNRRISAVGTAFNVKRQIDRVVVTVTEGTVLVTPAANETTISTAGRDPDPVYGGIVRMEAGQQIAYSEQDVTPVTRVDPGEAIAWRQGRLKYRGELLRYVVEDVNRYAGLPITIADNSAGRLSYTGTVFEQSIDSWLSGLEQVFPVQVERTPGGVVIRSRPGHADR